jgi:Fic family protein
MTYTEVKERHGKKYYYRVKSVRKGKKVDKIRKYLGVDLNRKTRKKAEQEADKKLNKNLNELLSKEEKNTLKKIKEKYKNSPKSTFENRYEAFLAKFTYDSNAIEGNTLSLKETSYLLFKKRTPSGKSLREINEALNHKEAFDYILSNKEDVTKKFICKIQDLVAKNTLREDVTELLGKYRTVMVFISGATFIPPDPEEVPQEMANLLRWYGTNKKTLHPLILAAYFHVLFESIHPFIDGNGRTGRLLINFMLHKHGFPMINIPHEKRLQYYDCLEDGRVGDLRPFVAMLYKLLVKERIYI